uniref:BVpp17a protein n=1 Tax=Chelonus inanitus TaxID=49201 RepID=D7FB46_9HYME|nr:BVpp17a protein [Chelonus inanitus]
MLQDYADSYEPLIIKQISPTEFEVMDDFDYNAIKESKFAPGYTQLNQQNYVQLPTGLVKPKQVSQMKFTFSPLKSAEDDDDTQPDMPEQSKSVPKMASNDGTSSSSSSSSSQSSSSDDE